MTILYITFALLCLIPLALTQQTGSHMIIAREPARAQRGGTSREARVS